MPWRNSFENEPTRGSDTPSARSPGAVTATLSVVSGFASGCHGSAVVTWSATPASHALPRSGGQSMRTNA
jgi:hypothetical protein